MLRGEILHCVQNDKEGGWVQKFNVLTTHLILRCAQNDKGELWVLISPCYSWYDS